MLEIKDVDFTYNNNSEFLIHIDRLKVASGESVLLFGESGSGKTTILSLIAGFLKPLHGEIIIDDQRMDIMPSRKIDQFRADHIGVIFQQFNLLPFASVVDNILLPLRFSRQRRHAVLKRFSSEQEGAYSICESLGLAPELLSRKAQDLSVGQQQRVAVARALIGSPPLIIADEPTSALDDARKTIFMSLLLDQLQKFGASILMVSHDKSLIPFFDHVVHMNEIVTTRETKL